MVEFVCPIDHGPLNASPEQLTCGRCGTAFPVSRGIPILLNEPNSVFRASDYTSQAAYGGASDYGGSVDSARGWRAMYHRFAQRLANPDAPLKFFTVPQALAHIRTEVAHPEVLVIGAGEVDYQGGDFTYTDVAFGRHVSCICDAHDLPFADNSFDMIIATAVLEHVADPGRCVAEFVRTLRPNGFVYAMTPFLQPVHMRAHDFTRFTYLGHRRLFRHFDDIQSGIFAGPATVLATVMRYTLLSLVRGRRLTAVMRLLGLLLSYPARYVDVLLSRRAAAYDAAFAVYFFGRKRKAPIADRDILAFYRGGG